MTASGNVSAPRLKSFIERIEKLREEKKAVGSDERDVFSEAKGVGFDAKAMREVLKRRAMDAGDRDEWDMLVDTYEHALGLRGEAARIVSAGGTYDEAAEATGLSRATVARSVASIKNAENETTKVARQEEEVAAGRDAIPGLGVADRSATSPGGSEHRLPALGRSAVVPLGCNTHPQPDEVSTGDQPAPCESPSGSSGPALCGDQPPPPESLGAVAKPEAERVASPDPDADTLDFPPHLNRLQQRALPPNKEK